MKKIVLILLSLTAVGLVFLNIVNAKTEPDLFKIASVLESKKMTIDQWSLHAREEMKPHEAKETLEHLEKQYPQWSWNRSETENGWELEGTAPFEQGIHQKISVLSTKDISYLIYEADGNGWSEKTKEIILTSVFEKTEGIFHGDALIFSCVSSQINDKIDKPVSKYAVELLAAFEAEEIELLNEEHFRATTAFSPLFSQSLKNVSDEINLQIGVRKEGLGEKTDIVVGTPIITVEY
jgi:hypothetical protein